MKKFSIIIIVSLILIPFSFTYILTGTKDDLKVSFLDVGQGDAIFIQTPSKVQILIDGGIDGRVLEELDRQTPFLDRTIDIVIATHPDLDHIGGLVDVLKKYDVDLFLKSGNIGTNDAWNSLEKIIQEKEIKTEIATRGDEYNFNDGVVLRILFPYANVSHTESNEASLVVQLVYNKQSFLFTADAPVETEFILVGADGDALRSNVLKLGHHGSDTSTAEYFLRTVSPQFAVISAGKNNRYGHPHTSVMNLLRTYELEILETSERGTIQFSTDGEGLTVFE